MFFIFTILIMGKYKDKRFRSLIFVYTYIIKNVNYFGIKHNLTTLKFNSNSLYTYVYI